MTARDRLEELISLNLNRTNCTVARYHGSTMSVVMINCRKSYYICSEQKKMVNRRRGRSCQSWRDNIKEWTGQSLEVRGGGREVGGDDLIGFIKLTHVFPN